MSAMLAKSLGARKVIALMNNQAYADLIEGGNIDVVINPHQATLGSILTHIRHGDVVRDHSLRRGQQKLSKLSPMVIRILPKLLVEKLKKLNFHLELTLGPL